MDRVVFAEVGVVETCEAFVVHAREAETNVAGAAERKTVVVERGCTARTMGSDDASGVVVEFFEKLASGGVGDAEDGAAVVVEEVVGGVVFEDKARNVVAGFVNVAT